MSYPKKIDRDTVLDSAMGYIEAHGLDNLSMRALAAELGVTPNALYRYFPSKADLEFAMADEAGKRMLETLASAVAGKPAPLAMVDAAKAYIGFSRRYPEVYAVKMRHCTPGDTAPSSHADIWGFVTRIAGELATPWNPEDLAVALWAFLHGMVALHRADLLEGKDPEKAIDVGLEVMLSGLMARMLPKA